MRSGAILGPTAAILGMSKDFSGVISSEELHLDRLAVWDFRGLRNLHVATEKANGPYPLPSATALASKQRGPANAVRYGLLYVNYGKRFWMNEAN
jgi:hypothetical protein